MLLGGKMYENFPQLWWISIWHGLLVTSYQLVEQSVVRHSSHIPEAHVMGLFSQLWDRFTSEAKTFRSSEFPNTRAAEPWELKYSCGLDP